MSPPSAVFLELELVAELFSFFTPKPSPSPMPRAVTSTAARPILRYMRSKDDEDLFIPLSIDESSKQFDGGVISSPVMLIHVALFG